MQSGLQDGVFFVAVTPFLHPQLSILRGLASPRMAKRSARVKWWKAKAQNLRVGTWNVRSLVESLGSVETASRRGIVVEDKKIDRVDQILCRYDIDIAGLQETHWFGNATYRVGGSLVLTPGRPVPDETSHCRRGEGVALVLSGAATEAWRSAGCIVEAVSSRLMYTRFKFTLRTGETQWVRVICAYTPLFEALVLRRKSFTRTFRPLWMVSNVMKSSFFSGISTPGLDREHPWMTSGALSEALTVWAS